MRVRIVLFVGNVLAAGVAWGTDGTQGILDQVMEAQRSSVMVTAPVIGCGTAATGDPVAACCADALIADSSNREVNCAMREQCRNMTYEAWMAFAIEKRDGKLKINAPISWKYEGALNQRQITLQKFTAGIACAERFFQRYGLAVSMPTTEDVTENTANLVRLYDDRPQTTSTHWALIKDNGRLMPDSEICNTIIHEMSHHLGVPDAYPDAQCPDRKIIPPPNVMHDRAVLTRDFFYTTEQIEAITKYLCKGASCS